MTKIKKNMSEQEKYEEMLKDLKIHDVFIMNDKTPAWVHELIVSLLDAGWTKI
jgi:hypothetical protein